MEVPAEQSGSYNFNSQIEIRYPAAAIDGAELTAGPELTAIGLLAGNNIFTAYYIADTPGNQTYQRYLVEADPKQEVRASVLSQFAPDTDYEMGIRIKKLEKGTSVPLEGAVFDILDPDGARIYSLPTDANGVIDLPLARAGTYTVTERVPPIFHLPAEIQTQIVTVEYNKVAEVTFENDAYGTLRVSKKDSANGANLANTSIQIRHITSGQTMTGSTDASGNVTFEKLVPGAYEIRELAAPNAGYVLDTTVHTVNVSPLTSGGVTSYTLTNAAKPGLKLLKIDRQNMTPIKDVSFEIYKGAALYGTYKTDANGEIFLPDLEPNTYTAKEVATLPQYVLDQTTQWITLTAGSGIMQLIFFNDVSPGIWLIKVDSETLIPLPNAVFLIKRVGGTYEKEFTTGLDGKIELTNEEGLDPAAYTVSEKSIAGNYLIDDAVRTIQINPGENAHFVISNTKKPSIEIIKYDPAGPAGGMYLGGASFRIARIEDGSHYLDRITDQNGRIVIDGLDPGVYSVFEESAPASYIRNDTEYHVELFPGKTSTLVVANEKKPNLLIVKTNALNSRPIENVTFSVGKVDSSTVSTVKTDANGEALLTELDPGVYKITEQSISEEYLLDDTPQFITLVPGRTGVVRFQNLPRSSLELLKTNIRDSPIPGAVFELARKDGPVIGDFTTDAEGRFKVNNLSPGYYVYKEKNVTSPYILDPTPREVYLEGGENKSVTVQNERKPNLTIVKEDSITGDRIKNAKFHIVQAVNDSLSGELRDLGFCFTDENGEICLRELDPSWLRITEVEPSSGYAIKEPASQDAFMEADKDKTVLFQNIPLSALILRKIDSSTSLPVPDAYFRIRYLGGTSGSGGTVIYDGPTSANGTIVLTGLKAGTYVAEEYKAAPSYELSNPSIQTAYISGNDQDVVTLLFSDVKMGGLVIQKLDSVSKSPIKNVTFRVTDSSGAVIGPNGGEYTTDAEGLINIGEDLPVGSTVIVQEIKCPDEYVIDTTEQSVKIKENTTHTLTFYNTKKGGLLLTKKDASDLSPIEGVSFLVTMADGSLVGEANGVFKTDSTGSVLIPDIRGTVLVREIATKEGYILDDTVKSIEVDDEKLYTLEFLNARKGGLHLLKLDEEKRTPIMNVEYELSRMNGERLGTYRTNASGIIAIPDLESGWYTIVEKSAKGYILDDTVHEFEVKDGETTRLELTNRRASGIFIHKVDSVSGRGIYGVEFLISDANGKPLTTVESDQNGYVYLPDIPDGKYLVRELEVQGYVLDTQVKTFYVEYGSTKEIIWKNTPITGQLQITKQSADDNPINGFPAGTLLEGAVFEIYDRANNLVDTIRSEKNGLAVSRQLPLARYTIREVRAPEFYSAVNDSIETEIEFSGQIVRLTVLNTSVYTNVSVIKRGYTEVVPGQSIRYDFKSISNNSTVPLDGFYWRDTLPTDAVRLDKIITGTWSARLSYKIVYKTNLSGENYRTLADNLSSDKTRTIAASAPALGLASNEYVTEIMFLFGRVPAGFSQVDVPYVYCDVLPGLAHEYRFTNKTDVGGLWGNRWIMANDRWVTVTYNKTSQPRLPRTGF
jgi:uncharacterized surface anchored protein